MNFVLFTIKQTTGSSNIAPASFDRGNCGTCMFYSSFNAAVPQYCSVLKVKLSVTAGIYRNFTYGLDLNALCDEEEMNTFCNFVSSFRLLSA